MFEARRVPARVVQNIRQQTEVREKTKLHVFFEDPVKPVTQSLREIGVMGFDDIPSMEEFLHYGTL